MRLPFTFCCMQAGAVRMVMLLLLGVAGQVNAQQPVIHFDVTIPENAGHRYDVEMSISHVPDDTLILHLPRWMPGYYQIMKYGENIDILTASSATGAVLPVKRMDANTWQVVKGKLAQIRLRYSVQTVRKFVATSYVDSAHAYLVSTNTFIYPEGYLQTPVTVRVADGMGWQQVATGLEAISGTDHLFAATNFDILYDCPILVGNLESLPAFEINGVPHYFTGYQLGQFDRPAFVKALQKVIQAGVDIMGDIPFEKYTFIAIGPGRGGIEHLNNTTVSFDGNQLNDQAAIDRMLAFLAHEYFHHYNVKRIRPFELGPFDYTKANRTNLLWVSEGFTAYYEYLMLRRAGVIDEKTLLDFFEGIINSHEKDQGKNFQTLQQASFYTWRDGPFGAQGGKEDRSISFYEKGTIMGLLLDFEIRNATQNSRSLDDVMRLLYGHYYQKLQRGFTDAEFQEACEQIAGKSLTHVFEYVYTTKAVDYNAVLKHAGLQLTTEVDKLSISRLPEINAAQQTMLSSWQSR